MPIRRGLEFEDQADPDPVGVVGTQAPDRVAEAVMEYQRDPAAYAIVQCGPQPTGKARRTNAIPMLLLDSVWEVDCFQARGRPIPSNGMVQRRDGITPPSTVPSDLDDQSGHWPETAYL